MSNPAVILSYRRSDSPSDAGRLRDALAARWGESLVFLDVSQIRAGDPFPVYIREVLSRCVALVSIIGPDWLASDGASGLSRLFEENDWVREEIYYALKNELVVVPVLVRGASPPLASALPKPIASLADYQAHTIRHEFFHEDALALARVIERQVLLRYGTWRIRLQLAGRLAAKRLLRLCLYCMIGLVIGAVAWVLKR